MTTLEQPLTAANTPHGVHLGGTRSLLNNAIIVFGGACSKQNGMLGATSRTLRYDVPDAEWSEVETNGDRPCPRYRHGACRTGPEQMAVFGGYLRIPAENNYAQSRREEMLCSSSLFFLHLPSWTWTNPKPSNPPTPRGGHSLTCVGRKLVILGGGQYYHNFELPRRYREQDLALSLDWFDMSTSTYGHASQVRGIQPDPRGGHSAILLQPETMRSSGGLGIIVFAGRDFSDESGRPTHHGRMDAHWLVFGKGCGSRDDD